MLDSESDDLYAENKKPALPEKMVVSLSTVGLKQ